MVYRCYVEKKPELSEAMSDTAYEKELPSMPWGTRLLCVESLPGQFDVRVNYFL